MASLAISPVWLLAFVTDSNRLLSDYSRPALEKAGLFF